MDTQEQMGGKKEARLKKSGFSHGEKVTVVFILTFLGLGFLGKYNEQLAHPASLLFITMWPGYFLLRSYQGKKNSAEQNPLDVMVPNSDNQVILPEPPPLPEGVPPNVKTRWVKWALVALALLGIMLFGKWIFAGFFTFLITIPLFLPLYLILGLLVFVFYKVRKKKRDLQALKSGVSDTIPVSVSTAPLLSADGSYSPRPVWAKYVAILDLSILVFGGSYITMAPLAMFIGLTWSGVGFNFLSFLILSLSLLGSLCFVVTTFIALYRAFSKTYQTNFSKISKILIITPLVSIVFAVVLPLGLFFAPASFTHQEREDVVYVNKEKIPRSEFAQIAHSPYAIRNGQVYVQSCFDCSWTQYRVMEGVSTTTFSVLQGDYARDKNNIYVRGQIVPEADPSSFEVVDRGYGFGSVTWKDKNHLFLSTKIISNNPDSYKNLDGLSSKPFEHYFVADNIVYLNGEAIGGADSSTFKVLSPPFSMDEKHVYCSRRIIEGADPKTFVTFESQDFSGPIAAYGKDARYAYFCSQYNGNRIVQIEEVDIDSFDATGMKYGYAKDKYHEYYFHGVGYRDEKTPYKVRVY